MNNLNRFIEMAPSIALAVASIVFLLAMLVMLQAVQP